MAKKTEEKKPVLLKQLLQDSYYLTDAQISGAVAALEEGAAAFATYVQSLPANVKELVEREIQPWVKRFLEDFDPDTTSMLSDEELDMLSDAGIIGQRTATFAKTKRQILVKEEAARKAPKKDKTPIELEQEKLTQEQSLQQSKLNLALSPGVGPGRGDLRRFHQQGGNIYLASGKPFPTDSLAFDGQIITGYDEVPELRRRHEAKVDDWDTVHLENRAPNVPRTKSVNELIFQFAGHDPETVKKFQGRLLKLNLIKQGEYVDGDGADTATLAAWQEVLRQAAIRNMTPEEALLYLERNPEITKLMAGAGGGAGEPTPEDRMRTEFRQVYFNDWGRMPTDAYLNGIINSGMNVYEFDTHERSKPAFKNSPRYQYDRLAIENSLFKQFGFGG